MWREKARAGTRKRRYVGLEHLHSGKRGIGIAIHLDIKRAATDITIGELHSLARR